MSINLKSSGHTHLTEFLHPSTCKVRVVPDSSSFPRAYRSALAPALAAAGVALLVALWWIGRPLWLDEEIMAINMRERTLAGFTGPLWLDESAPFAFLIAGRTLMLVLGTGERAIRLLPLAFGVATIAAAAWIGRRWMSPYGAALLVLLCASSRWLTVYTGELHPYSADVLFALLLPALGAWAVDDPDRKTTTRRVAMFWVAAAIGQLLANGALFVTPASAAVMTVFLRRDGMRGATRAMTPAALWLGAFGLNYAFTLRHALASPVLSGVWAFAFPPRDAGLGESIRWLATALGAFAFKPGGAQLRLLFWTASIAGLVSAALAGRRAAWAFLLVPVSGCLLAVLRFVPMYERLSIWIVPAMYVGIAFLADAAINGVTRRAVRIGAVTMAVVVAIDVTSEGARGAMELADNPGQNRSLDDRAAVRWLARQKQPGSVWVTTHYGLPAIWWYSGIGDTPIVELSYQPSDDRCPERSDVADALGDASRVLLYLGFRFDDWPHGFDDLLVQQLTRWGTVAAYRPVSDFGQAVVIDRQPGSHGITTLRSLNPRYESVPLPPNGCLVARPATIAGFGSWPP